MRCCTCMRRVDGVSPLTVMGLWRAAAPGSGTGPLFVHMGSDVVKQVLTRGGKWVGAGRLMGVGKDSDDPSNPLLPPLPHPTRRICLRCTRFSITTHKQLQWSLKTSFRKPERVATRSTRRPGLNPAFTKRCQRPLHKTLSFA